MNFNQIQDKFLILEKRARIVSDYFNPVFTSKNQHPYIADLRQEYQEDCQIINLNKYLIRRPPEAPAATNPIITEHPAREVAHKSSLSVPKPRRKQLKLDFMKQSKSNLQYKGSFSITKLVPKRSTSMIHSLSPIRPSFVSFLPTEVDDFLVDSDSLNYTLDEDQKQAKSYPDDISSDYIKRTYEELSKFSSKNSNYVLSPDDLLKINRRSRSSLNDFVIKYQTDPSIEIKSSTGTYNLTLTDIINFTTKTFTALKAQGGFILLESSRRINMDNLFPQVSGGIFEIIVEGGEKTECYYVSFNKFCKENEERAVKCINNFKSVEMKYKKGYLKLPKIIEGEEKKKTSIEGKFKNPITGILMKYRNKGKQYNTSSYIAKLRIFEGHEYIRNRYLRPVK